MRPPDWSPWLKGALGASLALNLVLGGVLLSRPAGGGGPSISRMQAQIERALPEADRALLRQALEAGRPRYEPLLQALRESRPAVREALAREPFDAAALRAAMARSRQRWQEFSAQYDDSLANGLAALSPEGRRLIAADMAAHEQRGREKRN
ncbi:periplasmic heavy metal sensor [Teichococcus aestuarii]|uniref:Periplasmic heavy metal sensor n=1 Tax=Teichococcus aestuarii TaxID=568898 RepID=A0A2U1V1B7_9PROT|nr:periplasmic heavy metal sensor [Pseudoroseomonas aestuarii]PWC27689.1 hypothetical protein CR165_16875 [Pseudoroseomonas aestuarii]